MAQSPNIRERQKFFNSTSSENPKYKHKESHNDTHDRLWKAKDIEKILKAARELPTINRGH